MWASKTKRVDEHKQVYIIYSNGLKISLGGETTAIDYSELMIDPFREESVGGRTAIGKDAFVKTTNVGVVS